MAYDRLEPFGEQRMDLRAGMVCATVANHSMSPPKRARKPTDYMLFVEPKSNEPILLADPKAQSDLIRRMIFGLK